MTAPGMTDLADAGKGTPGRAAAASKTPPAAPNVQDGVWRRWPDWVAYAAGAWSLAYGALGLYWAAGGAGFPFGENDPAAQFSALGGLRAAAAAPVIAALGLIGAVVAWAMAQARGRGSVRAGLLAYAWGAAVALLVVVPDARALVAVAYAPVVLLGAPFGWPPGDYRDAIPWSVLNQFVCIAGGAAWAATAVAYQRRTRVSPAGSRPGAGARWTRPDAAARWGRWATFVAAAVPLVYAATRGAWALGLSLGVTEDFLRQGQTEGAFLAGASLAAVAVSGSLLTLGLTARWGEAFPGWLPGLAGKRVPPALAIVPAAVVAVLVTNAGLTFWRRTLLGTTAFTLTGGNWAALLPELLWPVWGAALGAAALAYFLRRRPRAAPKTANR
jgi:hypothetical protein